MWVRFPPPALGFQRLSTFGRRRFGQDLDKKKAPNVIYRRDFLPSAAPPQRHFYDPAKIAGAVFGGGVGGGEVPHGFDVISAH